MRIGIDIRLLGKKRTGDESVFFNIVKQLVSIQKKMSDTDVFGLTLFIDSRSTEELSVITASLGIDDTLQRVSVIMLPTQSAFAWNMWVLPNYLKLHPVDVYHTQYIVPLNMPRNTQVVTHIHDVSFCVYPQYISLKDRFFLYVLIPRSLRRADCIVAVSEFTKSEISKYYKVPLDKIQVVYNAIGDDFNQPALSSSSDLVTSNGEAVSRQAGVVSEKIPQVSHFHSEDRRQEVRLKYNLPEIFILYVGTLQPRKNVPALIRAFAQMKQYKVDNRSSYGDRNDDGNNNVVSPSSVSLVLVGKRDGYHYDTSIDAVLHETKIESSVVFPGYVDQNDLPVLMSLARVAVFPSRYEGFGIPLLEAMSQGVPVLASDIPVHREIAGDAAAYVDTDDIARFSKVMYTIINDNTKRAQLISTGIVRSHDYTWFASTQRMLSIYTALCSKTISHK